MVPFIRPARVDERAALEALQRRASLALPDDREALLAHPEAINLPAEHIAHCLVAERDGAVAGFAVILHVDAVTAELDGLFVEPGQWRSGTGRALVECCAARLREGGITGLSVTANPSALDFYQRCGFRATGTTATQFGSAILMYLPLAPAMEA